MRTSPTLEPNRLDIEICLSLAVDVSLGTELLGSLVFDNCRVWSVLNLNGSGPTPKSEVRAVDFLRPGPCRCHRAGRRSRTGVPEPESKRKAALRILNSTCRVWSASVADRAFAVVFGEVDYRLNPEEWARPRC